MRISRFLFVFAVFSLSTIAHAAPPGATIGEMRTQISWRLQEINGGEVCYDTPEVFVISGEEAQTLVPPGSVSDGAVAEYLEELWSPGDSIALKIQVQESSETIIVALHADLALPPAFQNTGLGAFISAPDLSEPEAEEGWCCNYKGKVQNDPSCGCSVVCELTNFCPDASCKVCLVGEPPIDTVTNMCGDDGPFVDPALVNTLQAGDTL